MLGCNVRNFRFAAIQVSLNSKKDVFIYANVEKLKLYVQEKIFGFHMMVDLQR